MRIAIAGGTGFIGKALVNELVKKGHEIIILTRSGKKDRTGQIRYVTWLAEKEDSVLQLQDIDVFINLAGENIGNGRWTDTRKRLIVDSRINTTNEITKILAGLSKKPKVLINASAIGIYGTSEDTEFTEDNESTGSDFLASTVLIWESAAKKAGALGIRTVLCRFGVILDRTEGALPKMAAPYKAFAGGDLGSGRQWISWIHIEDVIRAILFIIDNEKINGPVNVTAPHPVRMKEFGKIMADILHRPHWFPAPGWALKLAMGEMSMLVLEGQHVYPKKLLEKGFQFKYPQLKAALKNIFPAT